MDLPGQRLPFSRSSSLAQRYHFAAIATEIGCVIAIGASAMLLAAYPKSPDAGAGFAVVTLLFVLSMIVRLIYSLARFDSKWYGYRAVVESMKRLSWLYTMRAGEFGVEDHLAEIQLRSRLAAIVVASNVKPYTSTVSDDVDASIPSSMSSTRRHGWQSRRATYLADRLDNQRAWYQRRARFNENASRAMTALMLIIQVIGIALALRLLETSTDASFGVPIIAFLVVLVSGTMAWLQAKQYSELVGPYSTARSELDQLREAVQASSTEAEFLSAIEHTEFAISREHVSWLANRGMPPASA